MKTSPARVLRPAFPWITVFACALMVVIHLRVGVHAQSPNGAIQRLWLLDAGAKSAALISDTNEGWRVLSAHWVHTGWMHLLFNLAFLFPVSAALECVLRRADFVLTLSAIAVSAGLASLLWTPEISAGASGLVYGVLGCAVMVGLRFAPYLQGPLRLHFGLWVLPFLLLILFFGANNPNLDHHNHLGGLLAGLLVLPVLRLRSVYDAKLGPWSRWRLDASRFVAAAAMLLLTITGSPTLVRSQSPAWGTVCRGTQLQLPSQWYEASASDLCRRNISRDAGSKDAGPENLAASKQDSSLPAASDLNPALNPHAMPQLRFANSSTLVQLRLKELHFRAGESTSWKRAWRRFEREVLIPENLRLTDAEASDCPVDHQSRKNARCTQILSFEEAGIRMRAQLLWIRRADHWLVASFETPEHWWNKYRPVREEVLATIRPVWHRPPPSAVIRAAIP